jgi:hypothetical protein
LRRKRANPPPTHGLPVEELPDSREQLLSRRQAATGIGNDHRLGAIAAKAPHEEAPEDLQAVEPLPSSHNTPDLDRHKRDVKPAYKPEQARAVAVRQLTHIPRDEYEQRRPPLSYDVLARLLVVLIILAGMAAAISWQWSNITELYQVLSHTGSDPQSPFSHKTRSGGSNLSGRFGQDQDIKHPPETASPGGQTAPTVAQRVVLNEEDSNKRQDRRYIGSVIWRTETVSQGSAVAPELVVRADADIPELRMTMSWSLRHNTDRALPASHTIEIKFNVPADFRGGGIAEVPGILMNDGEQAHAIPLAGLAVKVTDGSFIVGLSATNADAQHNEQLLKSRSWVDILILYAKGGRSVLAMEKGSPGSRVFQEAFASWEGK